MKKLYISSMISLFLLGCGSSTKTLYIGEGIYIDSVVQGVKYICGTESGVTDEDGKFYYELNKDCQFYIGNLNFKKVSASKLTDAQVTIQEQTPQVARLLQVLDIDGDPKNGITITQDESKLISGTLSLDDDDIKKLHQKLKSDLSDYRGKFVTLDQAMKHIDDVKNGTLNLEPIFEIPSFLYKNDSLTLDASNSKGDIAKFLWKIDNKTYSGKIVQIGANQLSLGSHDITLIVVNSSNKTKETTKSITIKTPPAPPTIWDKATTFKNQDGVKLLVTSDKDKLYFRFIDQNSSNQSITDDVDIYLDSDDDERSGTGSQGYDYKLNSSGLFKLAGGDDYNGVIVQDINASAKDHTLNLVVDRSNIEYLAQTIKVAAFKGSTSLFNSIDNSYKILEYQAPEDKIAPIFDDFNRSIIELDKGANFTPPPVKAYDVGDKKEIDATADSSTIDTNQPGYYTLLYRAKDSKGNEATISRIVHVKGAINSPTLLEKKLGDRNESVIIVPKSGQVWANDDTTSEKNTRGCLVVGEGAKDVYDTFYDYCKNSTYAGFNDWRIPTSIELSKFTIRMKREGKTPGMARKGCVRTLASDDNKTLKAVATHNESLYGKIYDFTSQPAGGRCVRGPVDNSTGAYKFETKDGGHIVLDDSNTTHKLIWVSEFDKDKNACMAAHSLGDYNKSIGFCEALDYAGFNDWRDPNSKELSSFIKGTTNANILPGYLAKCKKLIARDQEGNQTVERQVVTRFGEEANPKVGDIGAIIGFDLNKKIGFGLRCVRDAQ